MNSDLFLAALGFVWLVLNFLWEHREAIAVLIALSLLTGILDDTSNIATAIADEGKALRNELDNVISRLRSVLSHGIGDLKDSSDRLHADLLRLEEEIKALRSQSNDDLARIRKSLARLQVEIESWRADAWRSERKENGPNNSDKE